MNLELLIIGITIFLIANIYYDGKLVDTLKGYKKYYQIIFFAVIGLGVFLFVKKNPQNGVALFSNANQFIKYMPIDKNTSDMLTPIFDLTSKSFSKNLYTSDPDSNTTSQQRRMMNSGSGTCGGRATTTTTTTTTTKRSVSETKKKYVAAQQGWKCTHCDCQLPAWFEVDHKVRLDQGGSNHIDNLEALCRNCHGKKTAFENL